MPAVRCAARTLLRRTATSPAAVPRRLTHTEASEQARREVERKKEELYEAISKADEEFWTSRWRNGRLLQHLSMHVRPRPREWDWRKQWFYRRVHNVAEIIGFVTLYSVIDDLAGARKRNFEEYRDEAMAWHAELENEKEKRAAMKAASSSSCSAVIMEENHAVKAITSLSAANGPNSDEVMSSRDHDDQLVLYRTSTHCLP